MGQPEDAAVQKYSLLHSGTAGKPYPGKTFRSAESDFLQVHLSFYFF
jgi:hypothetical protein